MTAWLTSLRDRPIGESERAGAMAAVMVVLLAAAILLALSRPSSPSPSTVQRHPGLSVAQSAPSVVARATESGTAPLAPRVARAADLFLGGYLDYLYGHASARSIKSATPALLRSLRVSPLLVSPGMRARRPHVVALRGTPASSGLLWVSAVVNDGGPVDYSIGLLLAAHGGRLLVSGLEGRE